MNACLALWAVRLAWHIGKRHTEEDYRYKDIRKSLSKRGQLAYYIQAYFGIFMLQAVLSLAVNYTVLRVTAMSSVAANPFKWTDFVGLSAFGLGFLCESIGDAQLTKHIANPDPNKGKFCQNGLWRYTRHPNYFGEALLWWGFYFMATSVPDGFKTFFSPLLMTILLRYVSGVPLLEEKARKHPEWASYEAKTPCFIPWFPKASS